MSACAYSSKWKGNKYALNKEYALIHNHTHKYLGVATAITITLELCGHC